MTLRSFFVFLFLLAIVSSMNTIAGSKQRIKIKNLFKKDFNSNSDPTYSVTLRYQNMSNKINHEEKSNSSSFFSKSQESKIKTNGLGIDLGKEFLSDNYLSFSMLGRFTYNKGIEKDNKSNVTHTEKINSMGYGAGASINLNMTGLSMKIQPFISSLFMFHNTKSELEYDNSSDGADGIILNYDSKSTLLQNSLGVRFINNSKNLLSFASIDYTQPIGNSVTVNGTQGDNSLNLTNTSEIVSEGIGFSLGIGFLF